MVGKNGIGRSIAVHFAREGADIAIVYLEEDIDAVTTRKMVEDEGSACLVIKGDLKEKDFCRSAVEVTIDRFGEINILIHNAAVKHPNDNLVQIDFNQLEKTFHTNIFPHFLMTQAALEHMGEGDVILTTTSVTTYRGSEYLVDYASTKGAIVGFTRYRTNADSHGRYCTKGAIVGFTRSLAKMLAPHSIRVNGVAPGPIWTPLIPATFDDVTDFGQDTLMGRAGQPSEVAPAYVFLACDDSSYITGQIIHVNGGDYISS